jgi:hypothetical protein
MHKVVGFDILVNGVWRTSRDQEAAAYDAALVLKKRWPETVVTLQKPDGAVVMKQADGRTIDVAIRDLQEIEAHWGSALALKRLSECQAMLRTGFCRTNNWSQFRSLARCSTCLVGHRRVCLKSAASGKASVYALIRCGITKAN